MRRLVIASTIVASLAQFAAAEAFAARNRPPVAKPDAASTAHGTSVSIPVLANDFDPEGRTMTLLGATQGTGGATVRSGSSVQYTPKAGFSGTDSFSYKISDGSKTATTTVTVTVAAAANAAPVAAADSATTAAGQSVTINVLANDTDANGDALSLTATGTPANGSASRNGNAVVYTPNSGFAGSDSFSYTVSDGKATANATVSVSVAAAPNAAPVAVNDSANTLAGTAVTINVLGNDTDADGDVLSVTSTGTPANGSASRSGNTVIYTPKSGYAGADSFTYTVSDGKATASATVSVSVSAPPNAAPVAANDSASTAAGTAVTINVLGNDTDSDGDTLAIASVTQPAKGTTGVNAGKIVYTPASGFSGNDSFGYTVSDGKGGTDSATVSISVSAPTNRAPVLAPDTAATTAANAVTINVLANDSDPDGDTLRIEAVWPGTNGTVVKSGTSAIYTPATGFTGTDSFRYQATDGKAWVNSTVTVTVTAGSNAAPVAVNDSASTAAGTAITISVLANDSDGNGDALTIASVTKPANGNASVSGGSITYTPASGFSGSDSFGYAISDGKGGSASATVTVSVSPALVTSGTAVLSWSVPTTRANGTPLTASELAGYELYVLADSTGQSQVIALNDPLSTSYTVSQLQPDVYYFSIAAKDTAGQLSDLSAVVSKTVSQ